MMVQGEDHKRMIKLSDRNLRISAATCILLVFLATAIAADISLDMLTAAKAGNLDAVNGLIAKGEDVNATSAEGVTALMVAASENRLSVVRALLAAGADAQMKTATGKTAAFFASGKGNSEVAAMLEQAASKPPVVPRVSLLVSADYECTWKLDGESQGRLGAGDSIKVQTELGKHIIDAVTPDGADRYRQVVELTKIQQELITIGLKSVHDARLRAEEEARAEPLRRAEQARREEAMRAEAREAARPWKDPMTGLMWARKDNGSNITQTDALNYCRSLSLGGFRDWRLPEVNELAQIYDASVVSGSFSRNGDSYDLHLKGGIQMTSGGAWSATRGNRSGKAWDFLFYDGSRHFGDVDGSDGGRALCVRRAGE
jgi:hypothetical protein